MRQPNKYERSVFIIALISQQHIYLASITFKVTLLPEYYMILRNGCLNQEFLNQTDQYIRPETDMFASRLNKQIQIYTSWLPHLKPFLLDAFTINWNNMFIFSPFSTIRTVI